MKEKPYEIPPELKAMISKRLPNAEDNQVFLIPRELEGGIAIYQDAHLFAVKELRASGLNAAFLADSEERTFVSEFSHDVIYQIAFGVASNLTWDAAKAIWTYVRAHCEGLAGKDEIPTVRLQIARIRKGDLEIESLTLEGPATEETPEALLKALVGDESDD